MKVPVDIRQHRKMNRTVECRERPRTETGYSPVLDQLT